jgi:hypothetical protein
MTGSVLKNLSLLETACQSDTAEQADLQVTEGQEYDCEAVGSLGESDVYQCQLGKVPLEVCLSGLLNLELLHTEPSFQNAQEVDASGSTFNNVAGNQYNSIQIINNMSSLHDDLPVCKVIPLCSYAN